MAHSVLDQEDFRCTDVIFRQFKLYDICGYVDLKRRALGKGKASGWRETGQLILSMGLEWREFRTLALKATTPSKGFLHLKIPHVK
jgi:hypothetical protein